MAAAEPVTVDLTATQYVILSENQRKKKALAETKNAYNQLLSDNQALLQQLEDANKESYHATEHFRQEILTRNQQIADLQTRLEQLRTEKDEFINNLQEQAAAREAQLLADAEATCSELSARIDALQAELDSVLDYKNSKAEAEAQLAALREENVALRETLEAQRAQLERHYAGLHAKMRKEYEQKLEELKRSQEEELEERLDAGVKRILAANRRMAEELRLHVTESDALQNEVKLLQTERGRLAREVSLKQQLEEGWAQRAGQQAAALKEAQARISALERNLQQVMTDFAAERASVVNRAQAQVTASSSEVDALRRLLRLKGRELQQLRKLGQEVLLQRSEVEIFLLSSLHQVRLAIEQERSQAAAREQRSVQAAASTLAGSSSCSSGPSSRRAESDAAVIASTGVSGSQQQIGTLERCSSDIRDLSWEEREQVLRLLFAKVNGRTPDPRELPQHALGAALLGPQADLTTAAAAVTTCAGDKTVSSMKVAANRAVQATEAAATAAAAVASTSQVAP